MLVLIYLALTVPWFRPSQNFASQHLLLFGVALVVEVLVELMLLQMFIERSAAPTSEELSRAERDSSARKATPKRPHRKH